MEDNVIFCKHCGKEINRDERPRWNDRWIHSGTTDPECEMTFAEPIQNQELSRTIAKARRAQHEVPGQVHLI